VKTLEKGFNKVIRVLLVTLFSIITLLAVVQVVTRFAGISMSWIDEAMRFLFIWFAFIGSAYAIREKKHIVVDLLSESISKKLIRVLDILVHLIMLSFIFVLIKYGYEVANVMGIQKSSSMRIPMFYVFLAIPVSGILMLFYTILNIVDLIRGKEERI
jgi:TRAP-type transport system small permease protein